MFEAQANINGLLAGQIVGNARKPGDIEEAIEIIHSIYDCLQATESSFTALSERLFVGEAVARANGPQAVARANDPQAAPSSRSGQVGALLDALDRLSTIAGRIQGHAIGLQRL